MLIFLAGRRRGRLLALTAFTLIVLVASFSAGRGRVFISEDQFIAALASAGYVRVGRFGQARWPAVVVDRAEGDGGVSFIDARGQAHEYRGFVGRMRALRLKPVQAADGNRGADFVQVFGARGVPGAPLE